MSKPKMFSLFRGVFLICLTSLFLSVFWSPYARAGTLEFDGVPVDITTTTGEDLVIVPGTGGNTQFGDASGTNSNATSNDDIHVTGNIEADGVIYANGGIVAESGIVPDLDSSLALGSATYSWLNLFIDYIKTTSGTNLTLLPTSAYTIIGDAGSAGVVTANDDLFISGALEVDGTIYADGNVGIGTSGPMGKLIIEGGNVGIATTAPSTELEVVGTITATTLVGDGSGITGITSGGWTDDASNVYLTTIGDNVGMGTASPATKLQVVGTVTASSFVGDGSGLTGIASAGGWTDGGSDVYLTTTADNVGLGTSSPGAYKLDIVGDLRVGGTDFFVDDSTGNVGIGTTTPGAKLDVQGAITVRDGDKIYFDAADRTYIQEAGGLNIVAGSWRSINLAGGDGTDVTVTSTGNVGIGTTAPGAKLEVIGSGTGATFGLLVADSDSTDRFVVLDNGNVGIATTAPSTELEVVGTITATTFSGDGSGLTGIASAGGWTDGGTDVYLATTTDNVGIGTTGPSTKLDVAGVITATSGTSTDWNSAVTHITSDGSDHSYIDQSVKIASSPTFANVTIPAGGWFNADVNGYVKFRSEYDGYGWRITSRYGAGYDLTSGSAGVNSGVALSTPKFLISPASSGGMYSLISGSTSGQSVSYWQSNPTNIVLNAAYGSSGYAPACVGAGVKINLGQGGNAAGAGPTDGGTAGDFDIYLKAGGSGVGGGASGAASQMRVWDSSSNEILVINNAGNVGIGTTAPSTALEVVGTVTATTFSGDGSGITGITSAGGFTDGGSNVYLVTTADNVGLGTSSPGAYKLDIVGDLRVGATDFFVDDSTGNVGIGTTSPGAKLEVDGSIISIDNRTSTGYFAMGSGSGSEMAPLFWGVSENANNGLRFIGQPVSGNSFSTPGAAVVFEARAAGVLTGVTAGNAFSFDNGYQNPLMVIQSSGNVGIGSTAPSALLTTSGTTEQLRLEYDSSNYQSLTVDSSGDLFIAQDGGAATLALTNGSVGIGTTAPTDKLDIAGGAKIGSSYAGIGVSAPASGLLVQGNVGIGTTDPGSYALYVNGDTYLGGVTVTDGSLEFGGDLDMGSNIISNIGNTGTDFIAATGGLNLAGLLNADAGIAVDTNAFTVANTSGDVLTAGDLTVNGGDITLGAATALDLAASAQALNIESGLLNLDTSASRVGIGTTGPGTLVHGYSATADVTFTAEDAAVNGTAGFLAKNDATSWLLGINSSDRFRIMEGLDEVFIIESGAPDSSVLIDNSGNVGIGTTAAGQKLEVYGNSPRIRIQEDSSSDYYFDIETKYNASDTVNFIGPFGWTFLQYDAGSPGLTTLGYVDGKVNIPLGSTAGADFNVDSGKLVVEGDTGNVGIGTTGPEQKLDIVGGNIRLDTDYYIDWDGGYSITKRNVSSVMEYRGYAGIALNVWNGSAYYDALFVGGNSTANVGIGTTGPLAKLEVIGSGTGATFGLLISDSDSTDRAAFLDNGKVGIGTTGPSTELEVVGTVTATTFSGDGSGITGITSAGGWTDGGTDVYLATTTDNVGIGTTAPRQPLDIVEASVANYQLLIRGDIDGAGQYSGISFGYNGGVGYEKARIHVLGTSGNVQPEMHILLDNTADASAADINDAVLSLLPTGNVGIGTTAPSTALQVVGTVTATTFSGDGSGITGITSAGGWTDGGSNVYLATTADNVGLGTSSPGAYKLDIVGDLRVGGTDFFVDDSAGTVGIGTTAPGVTLDINGQSRAQYLYAGQSGVSGRLYVTDDSSNTKVYIPASGDAYFTNTGNVGIGTTAPGAKLEVAGSIWINTGSNVRAVGYSSAYLNLDSDTIMSAHNNLLFRTNAGVDQMRITADGSVGIGTTAPSTALEVVGTITATTISGAFSGTVGFDNVTAGTNSSAAMVIDTGASLGYTNSGTIDASTLIDKTWAIPNPIGATTPNTGAFTTLSSTQAGNFAVASGNVGIGRTNPQEKLHVNGHIKITGRIRQGNLGDLAEKMALSESVVDEAQAPGPGDVVSVDSKGGIQRSSARFATNVVGIISTNPAQILRDDMENAAAVALSGIVPCKVTSENGPITPGDLLVSSSTPGYAMRGGDDPMAGTIIGKALKALGAEKETGVVEVLVMMR